MSRRSKTRANLAALPAAEGIVGAGALVGQAAVAKGAKDHRSLPSLNLCPGGRPSSRKRALLIVGRPEREVGRGRSVRGAS